jgi:hypothetical protein
MVERVARGRIMVPAAAALGALSAGLLAAGPAQAAGQNTTLQMRVQVVDACQIRLAPSGTLDQACGSGGRALPRLTVSDLIERLEGRLEAHFGAIEAPVWLPGATIPAILGVDGARRSAIANQRAGGIAAQIAERVRFITLTY